jgi:hypothetical protein
MNRFRVSTFALAAAAIALSGVAAAQDQPHKLVAGNTELVHPLSSKSAAQGQAVTVKLTGSIKTAEGVELPRGTELIGHVDEVKPSDNKGSSSLVLTFNQARLKDGKTLAVKATLVGFAPAGEVQELPVQVDADSSFDHDPGASSGVVLHSSVQSKSSGTLTGNHRDVSFTAGTQFLVAVDVQPAQATAAAE